MNDDINDYLPSIINPRCIKKQHGGLSLTQSSIVSRCSLSLKRTNGLTPFRAANKPLINPHQKTGRPSQSKQIRSIHHTDPIHLSKNKENFQDVGKVVCETIPVIRNVNNFDVDSLGFLSEDSINKGASIPSFGNHELTDHLEEKKTIKSPLSISSATDLDDATSNSDTTISYNIKPTISVSFGVNNCDSVFVDTKNSAIKTILVSHKDNNTNVECDIVESSQLSTENPSEMNTGENMNIAAVSIPLKRSAVAVNLEIKKQKLSNTEEASENSKVLILNTNAIEKISHVIVQPPNYKLVKRRILDKYKFKSSYKSNPVVGSCIYNVNSGPHGVKLKQKPIDSFFRKCSNTSNLLDVSKARTVGCVNGNRIDNVARDEEVMSKNSGVTDAVKCERVGRILYKVHRKDNNESHKLVRVSSTKRENLSPRPQDIRTSSSDAPRVPSPRKLKNDSSSSHSPRKNVESIQFSVASKSKSNRTSISPRNIPHHKIVAGTHFAVDAFSYGDIPNVKHYFLTHFHSDHYSGLKKKFNKLLFCSKITADLCVTRLGVSPKYIHMINVDETIRVEGVEVTAVEANHCPGAIMLVFTLPNGKTLLHTGDFRASPVMESYPIFWNKDIHTIYLDTTYCNPRYDFPTQDQSLEMALHILRQKKLALEKVGKKFSSVLIVCGTYTIGKEKFFLGMARRVGCSVWACPEKDRVLQVVEGRSFTHAPPTSCQLHVVPMRDLTHEKLRNYMDSLQGTFSEVVAFKPSGWENGKNSSVEKDMVTIHGIPYSEHSSFSEIIRFVKFLKPKQVVPTVDISGGVKAVQKYFPCPLVYKEEIQCQSKVTDYFSIHNRQQVPAVT